MAGCAFGFSRPTFGEAVSAKPYSTERDPLDDFTDRQIELEGKRKRAQWRAGPF